MFFLGWLDICCSLFGWLVVCLVGWLVGGLVGWVVGCLGGRIDFL